MGYYFSIGIRQFWILNIIKYFINLKLKNKKYFFKNIFKT